MMVKLWRLLSFALILRFEVMAGSLQWEGPCDKSEVLCLNSLIFDEVGATADGRPFFKARGQPMYMYFDAHCDGQATTLPKWVLRVDDRAPNITAASRLYDVDCMNLAWVVSSSQRPPSYATWTMWSGRGIGVDDLLAKAVTVSDKVTDVMSESRSLQWDGDCEDGRRFLLKGQIFDEVGATADGRPFFKARDLPAYMYFEAHCTGQTTDLAIWVVRMESHAPNITAAGHLYPDAPCGGSASVISSSQRPPSSAAWTLWCDGDWQAGAVSLSDALASTATSETRTSTTTTMTRTTRARVEDTEPGADYLDSPSGSRDVKTDDGTSSQKATIVLASVIVASGVVILVFGILVAFVCLVWPRRRRPQEVVDFEVGAEVCQNNRHYYMHPSRWCVTMQQLESLLVEVAAKYPQEDPNVYTVVDEVVKPLTMGSNESYALLLNPDGLPIKHFITHAWAEGYKQFVKELQALGLSGGLWICFLANPQTWRADDLDRLLGASAWLSPFARALEDSESVVAVRNANANMYSRLWCVFELYLAHKLGKPVRVVGLPELGVLQNPVGYSATCTSPHDLVKLRAAMKDCAREVDVWTHTVMGMQSTP